MKRTIAAVILAAVTALGSAAAVAGMYFDGPHATHSAALAYHGRG